MPCWRKCRRTGTVSVDAWSRRLLRCPHRYSDRKATDPLEALVSATIQLLKPHGGQQNSPSQQPEGFHRSSFPILLGVNKSLGALPTARGVFVSVAGRHEGGLPRSDGPQPGRGGLPDASPEFAAPSFFVFLLLWGPFVFHSPGKNNNVFLLGSQFQRMYAAKNLKKFDAQIITSSVVLRKYRDAGDWSRRSYR